MSVGFFFLFLKFLRTNQTGLHTLFDCGLLAIEPMTRTVVIAEGLKTSSYAKLIGKVRRQPREAASASSRRNLEKRYGMHEAMLNQQSV